MSEDQNELFTWVQNTIKINFTELLIDCFYAVFAEVVAVGWTKINDYFGFHFNMPRR